MLKFTGKSYMISRLRYKRGRISNELWKQAVLYFSSLSPTLYVRNGWRNPLRNRKPPYINWRPCHLSLRSQYKESGLQIAAADS